MGLFRPYERTNRKTAEKADGSRLSTLTPKVEAKSKASPTEPEPATSPSTTTSGDGPTRVARKVPRKKEGATPTREEAEAARMERLHPSLNPKQQRKADREARTKNRMDAWDKMENSRERQLLRDYVDTRWTIAEFMLPAMLLVMAAMMLTIQLPIVSTTIGLGMWALMLATIINVVFMWRGYKKMLAERLPGTPTRGLGMYMFNRALMIRRFRRPAPEINRGDPIR